MTAKKSTKKCAALANLLLLFFSNLINLLFDVLAAIAFVIY